MRYEFHKQLEFVYEYLRRLFGIAIAVLFEELIRGERST